MIKLNFATLIIIKIITKLTGIVKKKSFRLSKEKKYIKEQNNKWKNILKYLF